MRSLDGSCHGDDVTTFRLDKTARQCFGVIAWLRAFTTYSLPLLSRGMCGINVDGSWGLKGGPMGEWGRVAG